MFQTRRQGDEVLSRLLVLGGTSFVGRAVVADALARGIEVTSLNRGTTGADAPGVRVLRADRNDPTAVAAALAGHEFDAVIDVSGLAPAQVAATARVLSSAAPHYALVSTVTTYAEQAYDLPPGGLIDEDAPTVLGDPDDPAPPDMAVYGEQKRGCELALLREFGPDATLIARPGLILGPHENVHRVPYWLGRIAAGGDVIAPGHADRAFQFVDVRDLAEWLVTGALDRLTGTYNVVNPPGRDTWGDWLGTCRYVIGSQAQLHWIDDETLIEHGVEVAWGLPMWFAADGPDFADARVHATGFRGRPLVDTVTASWQWLRSETDPPGGYRPPPMTRAQEQRVLEAVRRLR